MTRATVVYTHGGGRLGNQLIRFAHWIAWANEHQERVEVLNFNFWPYAGLFETWREQRACLFPARMSAVTRLARLIDGMPSGLRRRMQGGQTISRLIHRLGRSWPGWQAIELDDAAGESIELADPAFLARVTPFAVTTCAGWKVSAWGLFEAQEQRLRGLFRPSQAWLRRGEEFMKRLRREHDCVIGLLIRQTDYRNWQGGRFWYPTEEYARWARQLLDLRLGRNPAIVIACDEYQDPGAFSDVPHYFSNGAFNQGGHWFESFVALSLCDLVASPPSTFSAGAAFVGNVPLLPLAARGENLSMAQVLPRAMLQASRHPVFSLAVK